MSLWPDPGFYDGTSSGPYRGVDASMKAGKRKRGNSSMSGNAKARKVRQVSGNITREQLLAAPEGSLVNPPNRRGVVKIIVTPGKKSPQ